jgi:hypothetical protein
MAQETLRVGKPRAPPREGASSFRRRVSDDGRRDQEERMMDEDRLNMSVRKFLKVVGVTSQREIETAVRGKAPASGKTYKAKMVLTVDELGVRHEIDGEIET